MKRVVVWYELARLVLSGDYRRGSRYWAWRRNTAFGGPRKLTRAQRSRALREFVLWVRTMRGATGR